MTWETIEFNFLYYLQTLHNPWLDQLMPGITSLGDAGIVWIISGLVFLCFGKTRRMGIAVLISLLIGVIIGNLGIKNLVRRARPSWIDPGVTLLIQNPTDYSFMSGHSLASFGSAVSMFLAHKSWGIPALVLAVLIAFSRLYLFVHFPTDVLAGALLGMIIAIAVNRLLMRYYDHRRDGKEYRSSNKTV